jgi:CRP-like cAMP-binding protein
VSSEAYEFGSATGARLGRSLGLDLLTEVRDLGAAAAEELRVGFCGSELAQGLSPDCVDELFSLCSLRRFQAGDVLVDTGLNQEFLWIVLSGQVEFRMRCREPIALARDGVVFGVEPFFQTTSTGKVVACEGGEAFLLPLSSLNTVSDQNPRLGMQLARVLGAVQSRRVKELSLQLSSLLEVEERQKS